MGKTKETVNWYDHFRDMHLDAEYIEWIQYGERPQYFKDDQDSSVTEQGI